MHNPNVVQLPRAERHTSPDYVSRQVPIAAPVIVERRAHSPDNADRISRHILPTSGTMVGVCVTIVGLVKIAEAKTGPSSVDEFAALAAVVFLISAITSYLSFRRGYLSRLSDQLEKAADATFIMGLISITAVAVLFAFEII